MHQYLFGSRAGRANEVSVLGKTALIVDDSKTARVVLKRVLETHALVVDTAESAETALEYLSDHRPDVIFMDHMMPGMDGLEAVSAIKNNPDTATIPIMMYTSQKGEVYVGQARALGAVGVLPKEVEPVEVSKMLASLRVIDSHVEGSGEAAKAESAPGGDDAVDTGQPDQSIRILLHDLFDQQRAILRRDLQDSYETIAAKVVDEIRVPTDDEKDPVEKEPGNRVPANYQVAAAVLAIIVLTFGWLYWEREQSWLAVQQQNDDLIRALEQQQSIEAQGAIEVQQRLDGYQQSLGNAYESALRAIEWGINQTGTYEYGRMPLDDARLPTFEALLAQLLELGFTGQVRIETHVGDFCLSQSGAGTYVPAAAGLAVSQCDLLGLAADEALEQGRQQSVAFANFVSNTLRQTSGQIRFDIVSLGISEPLVDYPVAEGATTAAQWNAIAEQNNRINVTLYPD
jgi:CheY-like chemotaxis protein